MLILTKTTYRTSGGGLAGRLRVMFAYVSIPGGRTVIVKRHVQADALRALRRARQVPVVVVATLRSANGHPRSLGVTRVITVPERASPIIRGDDRALHAARRWPRSGPTTPASRRCARSRSPPARRWTARLPEELEAIRAATFTVEAINEREKVTDHDTAAFVDVLAESAGPAGRWIHYGLTSSDVLDTGLALQLRAVADVVLPEARPSRRGAGQPGARTRAHAVRRAHPRDPRRADDVRDQARGVRVRGGAQRAAARERRSPPPPSALSPARSGRTAPPPPTSSAGSCSASTSSAEPVSTQVVARDRHAQLLQAIALAGAGLERFTTELRHLARTEVAEVREPFGAGQKGSSAMPHKRNPIKSEQVTGLARVLRGNAQAAVEDVALWHERDISHSSVERVILPDSTILLDHMQRRVIALVEGMVVDAARMRENLEITHGALFSQRVLLALVERGLSRDDAYRVVQRLAQQALDERTPMRELLAADPAGAGLDLDAIFDYAPFVRYADEIVGRLDVIA